MHSATLLYRYLICVVLVLFDKDLPDVVLACGSFRELRLRKDRAVIAQKGLRDEFNIEQRSPFDPTRILVNLTEDSKK